MDEGYTRLHLAIFKQAIFDSTKSVKTLLFDDLRSRGIEKKEIHHFIDHHAQRIEQDVQEMVYAEAQRWPHVQKSFTLRNEYKLRDKYTRKYFDDLRKKEMVG